MIQHITLTHFISNSPQGKLIKYTKKIMKLFHDQGHSIYSEFIYFHGYHFLCIGQKVQFSGCTDSRLPMSNVIPIYFYG